MEIKKEVKDLGASNVQLDVTIGKKDGKEAYDKLLKKYAKTAQIPGFRKGKVPVSILEQKFGEAFRMESATDLIEQALEEVFATDDRNIKPLGYEQPELVGELKFDPDEDFTFSVKYDIFPKVELTKTEGFLIKNFEVTDIDELFDKELKHIQISNSFVLDKKEGESTKKGDLVTIDYWEVDENGKMIEGSKREDFAFEVGTGMNLYKIDDDIVGMKKDEEKTIEKEYPADFDEETLAGKKVKLQVKLRSLKYRDIPELDDELAQDVNEKFKTLDDLKNHLKQGIDRAVEVAIRQVKQASYLKAVVEANEFIVPESMINANIELQWGDLARQLGISPEQLEKTMGKGEGAYSKDKYAETIKPQATTQLKERIIIEKLLEQNSDLTVSDEEFQKEIKDIAENAIVPEEEVQKHYANENQKNYLIEMIKERKLFELLLDKCKMEKSEKIKAIDLLEKR
ncbi:MAG: trigger factor [Treponemataceae bacterium]